MAPGPSHSESGLALQLGSEDVVISGLSGRLPESDNIAEFRSGETINLYTNKLMLVGDSVAW